MKVTLKRTGGVGGMTRQWELDINKLPSQKALEFRTLLETTNFFALGASLVNPAQSRDRFCYELTVEKEGKKHTVQCSEESLSAPLRRCLDWITARSFH